MLSGDCREWKSRISAASAGTIGRTWTVPPSARTTSASKRPDPATSVTVAVPSTPPRVPIDGGPGSPPSASRPRPARGPAVASPVVLTVLTVLVGVLAGFAGARVLRRPASSAGAASIGRSVGGAIGSRRDLDLPHLQRSTLSEMLRHVRPERGAAAVPGEFRVRLHPEDKATVDQAPGFFRQGLEQALTQAGDEHGWTMPPRLRIDI